MRLNPKHGFPAGNREQFEAFYALAFAPRVAALAHPEDSSDPNDANGTDTNRA